jgi:hypothetical protein
MPHSLTWQGYDASAGPNDSEPDTEPNQMPYKVTDSSGKVVNPGDTVVDFRGDKSIFLEVTRAPEVGRDAKVYVKDLAGGWKQEFYARVFDLTVEPL